MPMTSSLFRPALVAALVLLPGAAFAGMRVDPTIAKPAVQFNANGEPGALDIEAKTADLAVTDDGTTLSFVVKLDTVSTGIALRDEHMKEKFLHTKEYPDAILAFPKASIVWPTETGTKVTGTLDAQFTAHGVAEPVKVKYDVQKTKQGWKVTSSFAYNTNNHKIEVPSYLGITVDAAQTAKAVLYLVDAP
jgi:polyisoprenoid-binding protein YceI